MRPFHTIAIPHDDILRDRLTLDVFAADLWEVYKGRGSEEYRDPTQFFQKTYVTAGLTNLLDVVHQRLQGQGGDPVLQLQTPFGGGKTHALIALYHKAAAWGVRPVVFVGTPLAAADTPWIMLEEQLTGQRRELRDGAAPGRESLRNLLLAHQPVLILMDELPEYMTKAAAVRVGDTWALDDGDGHPAERPETLVSRFKSCPYPHAKLAGVQRYAPQAQRQGEGDPRRTSQADGASDRRNLGPRYRSPDGWIAPD